MSRKKTLQENFEKVTNFFHLTLLVFHCAPYCQKYYGCELFSSFLSFFYVSVEGYKNLCDVLCLFEWMLNRKISRFSSPPFLVHFSAFVLISHPSIAPPPPAHSSSFVCKVLNFKSGRQKEHSQKNYRFSFSSPLLLFLPSSEHSLYSVTRLSRPPTRRRKSRFGTPVTEGGGDGEEGKILNFKLLSTRTLITSSSRAAVEKKIQKWNVELICCGEKKKRELFRNQNQQHSENVRISLKVELLSHKHFWLKCKFRSFTARTHNHREGCVNNENIFSQWKWGRKSSRLTLILLFLSVLSEH